MAKTILVTGATDGIGHQTARELARQGARVLVHGRNPGRGEEVVAELRRQSGASGAQYYQADFADLHQVAALAEQVKREQSPNLSRNAIQDPVPQRHHRQEPGPPGI